MLKAASFFNVKISIPCLECSCEIEKDSFFHLASPSVICPDCGKEFLCPIPGDELCKDLSFYEFKFIDAYMGVTHSFLSRNSDFAQEIKGDPEDVFGRHDYFSNGIVNTCTALELLLYDLLKRGLEKIKNNKTVGMNNILDLKKNYKGNVAEILGMIISGNIKGVLPAIETEYGLSVKEYIRLLQFFGNIRKKDFDPYRKIQSIRNDIVHCGYQVDFEDYANAFIVVGNIFKEYRKQKA